ncbi:methyltransferase domain-containing protein [Geovibrio thiophilus]|uniref:Methyltransferase domain-containing protein n=1 Tax=Geovibrio thiophilus TaxID=139438 RepID=A0A3R5UY69_9BACT|nr:50S ribosomal protein L11 methyltransferase [Geovibrio thiophilus]QAR33367.1 methyltransferase domain-containing protein [Geovibrio thiophilus]
MKEYRYFTKNEELEDILFDMELTVIEDDFKNEEVVYIVYADTDLSSVFSRFSVEFTVRDVSETGWEEKWKEFLQPGWLTDNVYCCFDSETAAPSGKAVRIIPALAFGTGTHATTQAAARLLESVAAGRTVADVGCGSAILAITASVCGAEKVYAFDIDDMAMGNARDNIELNGCTNIQAWTGGIESLNEQADVVVANIITGVLKSIHDDVISRKPEYIVYSGILLEEYEEFMSSIDTSGYVTDASAEVKEWKGVRLKRCWE